MGHYALTGAKGNDAAILQAVEDHPNLLRECAVKVFWLEPVSYITETYEPGEIEAILRNTAAKREQQKGGG